MSMRFEEEIQVLLWSINWETICETASVSFLISVLHKSLSGLGLNISVSE